MSAEHAFTQFPHELTMSKAGVEQALTGLIPTLNGPLPPELLELALSLLTRSRSVASSLKSDEEIARPYACAQIACERLKKRLNLPTITSRPPCAPRVYKKLYAYLTSALISPSTEPLSQPQTPRKNKDTAAAPSARNTPSKPTASARTTPKSTRGSAKTFEEAPEWVMPAIRSLVRAFAYPAAAPHVYTGVETILPLLARMTAAAASAGPERPSKRFRGTTSGRGESSVTRVLGLIAALFLYVITRMKDVEVLPEQYAEWRETTVRTLAETQVGAQTSYEEISRMAEVLMPMAQEEGWLRMEWFLNILPEGSGREYEGLDMAEGNQAQAGAAAGMTPGTGVRSEGSDYIGLGTMMQDATDYLGQRQRADYAQWKSRILARAREIETTS
ncbi:hypothetical protein J1614_009469 [Plenodomus biglobosus]|nr:hypothetical protein J1614_009469 [Plenodomus biglobosus]